MFFFGWLIVYHILWEKIGDAGNYDRKRQETDPRERRYRTQSSAVNVRRETIRRGSNTSRLRDSKSRNDSFGRSCAWWDAHVRQILKERTTIAWEDGQAIDKKFHDDRTFEDWRKQPFVWFDAFSYPNISSSFFLLPKFWSSVFVILSISFFIYQTRLIDFVISISRTKNMCQRV